MRTDKKKNIAKVAKAALKSPLSTEREIAEKVGIGAGTVHRAKKELEQTGAKDDRIAGICQKDIDNIQEMQELVTKKIRDTEEMSNTRISELAQVMREATARYTIFKGDITDSQGGMKKMTKDESDLIDKVFSENLG